MRRAISCVTCDPKSRMRILSWFMWRDRDAAGTVRWRCGESPPGGTWRATGQSSRNGPSGLEPVVGRFLGDADVVHVRLAHAGRRDLDKLGPSAHLLDGVASAVAHAGAQAARHLEDDHKHAALVGNHALDTFRHELVDVGVVVLEIALG